MIANGHAGESDKMNKSQKAGQSQTLRSIVKATPDITAEERFYNRSLKIRMGVKDSLSALAKRREPQPWTSWEDLAIHCANWVNLRGWDTKPASLITALRWIKQETAPSGSFRIEDLTPSLWCVVFASKASRQRVSRELAAYTGRRATQRAASRQAAATSLIE